MVTVDIQPSKQLVKTWSVYKRIYDLQTNTYIILYL